jgi:hypothetical protein
MLDNESIESIRADIQRRWQIVDWRRPYPWWPRPAKVKILFYADGSVRYDGGPFYGLKQVIATLTADPYSWVSFDVTTANRSNDPSADHDNVDLATALALDDFDELWIYSINSGPQLNDAELAAARTFMDDRQGGVLITGDHAALGAAFGNLPRAGKMRRLPAPPSSAPTWNNTLRSGANSLYEFVDQSDEYPQPLQLKWYWGGILWRRPHELLCSPIGPIDVFPDHQHEGEAIAPVASPASEWPGGVAAEVIATGRILSPDAQIGREVGVLSVYNGHEVDVGRIVADSTWHHHFDINLRGEPTMPTRNGFVTPGTDDWLSNATKIEHFFLNAAIWLAPPAKQSAMRFAAMWPSLWLYPLIELDRSTSVISLGRQAFDALGRKAPQCAVFNWIWGMVPTEIRIPYFELLDRPDPPPYFEYVAGLAVRTLLERFEAGPDRPLPLKPPTQEEFDAVLDGIADRAVDALIADAERRVQELRELKAYEKRGLRKVAER